MLFARCQSDGNYQAYEPYPGKYLFIKKLGSKETLVTLFPQLLSFSDFC